MTILMAKLSSEKRTKGLKEPLVENEAAVPTAPKEEDVESGGVLDPKYVNLGVRARRVSTATTVCLFLTALLVMSIGVIGGVYLYKQFARSQMEWFRGRCRIPLHVGDLEQIRQHEALLADATSILDSSTNERFFKGPDDGPDKYFFPQNFELDLESESIEKIDVPDFGNGRRGRFIHDFNTNKTGIVDVSGGRCFVMPLNRQRVLPPQSMYDLIKKMWDGYYEVDTQVVREDYRVVVPPVTDFNDIGQYIFKECVNKDTYMLEKYADGGMFKRSTTPQVVFAEFAGSKISEMVFDMSAVEEFEKSRAA